MKTQKTYEPPRLKVIRVVLEKSIADTARVSVDVSLRDWEEGGELGGDSGDGGDVYLFF